MCPIPSTRYIFVPDHREVGHISEAFNERDIEAEPQLYSASHNYAEANGGPITQAVLRAMPPSAWAVMPGRHIVIDSRVHMLMPGMYPAIPGWHCDAWPRTEAGKGQPDPTNRDDKAYVRHWAAIVGDASLTEFITDPVDAWLDPEHVWESVSKRVYSTHATRLQGPNTVVEFGPDQLHRAMPADRRGWRFWLRLSHYQRPPQNKIRKQSQVYVTEHGGW